MTTTENTDRQIDEPNEMYQLMIDALLFLGFVWNSFKRHRALAGLAFIAILGLSVAMLSVMTRIYRSSADILAHPSRTLLEIRPGEGRRSAAELIRARENLIAVIDETHLVEDWKKTRTDVGRLKDSAVAALLGPMTDDQLKRSLIPTVRNSLRVNVNGNVINVAVDWHVPQTAHLLVNAFVKRFLDDQLSRELAGYKEEIVNFEKKLVLAEKKLEAAGIEYGFAPMEKEPEPEKIEEEKKDAPVVRYRPKPPPTVSQVSTVDLEMQIEELERQLSMKRQEISRLERTYEQRLSEAKNTLAEKKTSLGPQHPDVIKASRYVAILSQPPQAIESLRSEEEHLAIKLEQTKKELDKSSSSSSRRRRRVARSSSSSTTTSSPPSPRDDPLFQERYDEYMRIKISRNTIAEQLANAKIELEAARDAFEYRFKVTQPSEVAKSPIKPKPARILVAAIVAGILLGVFLALFVDIKSGRVLEVWQMSRLLKIPVLGELEEK